MFPPPQPWKQIATTDPQRTYLAFTSRFAMRSWLRVPAFVIASRQIARQVESSAGVVGYSLGADLPRLFFYTLSVWEDEESLRAFSRALQHGQALRAFHGDMRFPSPFIRWHVRAVDLPLRWDDALVRIAAHDQERLAAAHAHG